MSSRIDVLVKKLDEEWIELIQMAREMGITIEEIREFLASESKK
ncbi:anti-repressor SinI family protein [Bacillus songklensis]|uniref:Anti-repressor SinI family protein n=1 Tax=Bacillus songklensis TaxID=1069116 RepID=A0ABV8B6K3_9BACI